MSDIELNSDLFDRRCAKISKSIGMPLLLLLGKSHDVLEYSMNSALFHFLLGYEFPETMLIIQENPIVITSPKKAMVLQQIKGLKIVIKNKDDSNLESILDMFSGVYAVIDKDNIKGDLAAKVFNRVKTKEVTQDILHLLSVKEQSEIDYIISSGVAANHLLRKGIDMIRDDEFSKEAFEGLLDERIDDVDESLLELSFDPEYSSNHLRIGVRFRGYCTEIARQFLADVTDQYDIQKYVLTLVRPGVRTSAIMAELRKFLIAKDYRYSVRLYTLGLVHHELDFDSDFEICNKMCFCLNIDDTFCNTFVVNEIPIFATKKDTPEDYSTTKMRFRNRNSDVQVIAKIKEHQKELLDALIEDKIAFYKTHGQDKIMDKTNTKEIALYKKDSAVPRSPDVYLDWENFYVLVPILSYSVPFHISSVKNVSVVTQNDQQRLRINFKESKEIKEAFGVSKDYDTKIKFITVATPGSEHLVEQINEMRKEFNKPKISLPAQPVLKEKFRKHALPDVYMRTDSKGANKKTLGNLELHENGFKYGDVNILFSNIKNIFYQPGDYENRAILHFNLKEPILFVKPTYNVQFFRRFAATYHDTSKREGEDVELLREKEEEEELGRINTEFLTFVERIEQETPLRVQIPEKAFLGVHSREAAQFYITNECLVSIHELPFVVLNFDDIEVASFERITFITKTFDCVFIFHDRSRPMVTIASIETTRLGYLKEVLDSQNILFMENKININWANLMQTIMQDPLSFYENGAWAELLREAEESESESEQESSTSSAYSDDEDDDDTTSYDEDEDEVSSHAESEAEDDDSYVASDSADNDDVYSGDDDTVSGSSEEKPKKRKTKKS